MKPISRRIMLKRPLKNHFRKIEFPLKKLKVQLFFSDQTARYIKNYSFFLKECVKILFKYLNACLTKIILSI